MILLTDGYRDAHTAKTAICVIRYRPEEVVGRARPPRGRPDDRRVAGHRRGDPCGRRGWPTPRRPTPWWSASRRPAARFRPPGGRSSCEAAGRGMTVISGLHDFLADDRRIGRGRRPARRRADRPPPQRRARRGQPPRHLRAECLRIHTVGNDCSCGKMVAAVEVARGLRARRRGRRLRRHRARPASSWPAAAARSIA